VIVFQLPQSKAINNDEKLVRERMSGEDFNYTFLMRILSIFFYLFSSSEFG
jgi:hypothetical protein